ncbi:MAG: D-alanine--D-alanine ligase [Spirochaetes bacterium]|nr:MAG: D-alanine--D-alanine ligase [Spirochaetota bacterium]
MVTIAVLYGGRSGEHEVSLCSAASVVSFLDKQKYSIIAVGIDKRGVWHVQEEPSIVDDPEFGRKLAMARTGPWLVNHYERENKLVMLNPASGKSVSADVVFPVLHGTYGEDGTLQGLLELAMVPYVGADVLGSSVGMDKDVAKRLLESARVPVVPWITVHKSDWIAARASITEQAQSELGLPMFIKPACTGSSVGISKVKSRDALDDAMTKAFKFDTRVLIEKAVQCREIECAVLGNERPQASVLGEIVPRHEFYSYEAKYIDPNGAELRIPADISPRLAETIRDTACRGYSALGCGGMARVDFFLEKNTGEFFLNEINTLPGFTSISMYPKLWEASGLSYADLLDRLVDLALERHRARLAVQTDFTR